MSVLPKPSFLTATAQIVPNILKPAAPACVKQKSFLVQKHKEGFLKLPKAAITACNSLSASHHIRLYHSDVAMPDFTKYRKEANKDPTKSNQPAAVTSRAFTYTIAAGGMVTGIYGGKILVNNLLDAMTASADVLALAKIEVDLSAIPEGKNVLMKWRGKPLFVRHRTAEEVETEKSVNLTELRDPQHDSDRVQKDEWLIVLGICTHLGCVPVGNAGAYGGYYCPCHGSHYDKSGRIRKGPAPLNLEVPPYEFADDTNLVVG